MSEQDNLEELMQAFNGHEITNENGDIEETETSIQEPSPEEQTTEEEPATAEPAAEEPEEAPEASNDSNESDLAEDESGQRYVPENRFKEVYGKMKELERKLTVSQKVPAPTQNVPQAPMPNNKADVLENELLFTTLPQFDPNSEKYSQSLDRLAATIYKGTPGLTKIQAAKEAIKQAKDLASKEIEVRQSARTVKSQQADQGITTRVSSSKPQPVNPDNMSLDEMEAYLKKTGQW